MVQGVRVMAGVEAGEARVVMARVALMFLW